MASFTPLMNRVLGPGTSETENEFRYLIRRIRREYRTHHGEWDRLIAVRKMDDSHSDGDGVILRSPEYGTYEMEQGQRVLNDKDLPA